MLLMTMIILVGEGKGCTRHLTNSLSTQPDNDDADGDDVVARLMSAGSCCGGSGVRPLLPSPSEVADASRGQWGLAAGDLVYGLCCPLPVKLQTPQDDSAMWLGVLLKHSLTFEDNDDDDVL